MSALLSEAAAREALGTMTAGGDDPDATIERYATVIWSHLVEPGDAVAGRLTEAVGRRRALDVLTGQSPNEILTSRELHEGRKRWMPRLDPGAIAHSLRIAQQAGVRVITRADEEWPQQLDDLGPHSPHCLWVRGDADLLSGLRPAVALVGARASTSYGDLVARELAADLAGGGIPVISGGAYGIDGASHRAALGAGGLTMALLAGGVDRAYPAGHSSLIDQVIETGIVASEVPCGSAPTKWRFLQRNRLIAAISDATVVVEAGWRSGSLNTAGHAAALGRQLGAVPGPVTSATSAGAHRLLREFGATCITSSADVRELLGVSGEHAPEAPGSTRGGTSGSADRRPDTDDGARVRDALSSRIGRDVADIARRSGMSPDQVEPILGLLLLDGSVVRTPAGWLIARSRA